MTGTKTILAFGDSLTWGADPVSGGRHRFEDRWPSVLEAGLGGAARVIAEGLGGRTTMFDDHGAAAERNGVRILPTLLGSHHPLDLVIIMLGTNDLKIRFNKPASEVAMGIGCLIYDLRELAPGPGGSVPEIMIVAPPPILDDVKEWKSIFAGAPEKSRQLALEFEIMADSLGVHFFNAGSVCSCDEADGFHLNADAHRALGAALAQEIEAIGWPTQQRKS